jgi:preprotein translocase subunit SecE
VARQTRAERKERRRQQLADGATRGRARPAAPARAGDGETTARAVEAAPAPSRRRGNFIAESWAELKKVEWPGQRQVVQGTAVVLIACGVVGVYLWGADLVLKRFVENVLLGQ